MGAAALVGDVAVVVVGDAVWEKGRFHEYMYRLLGRVQNMDFGVSGQLGVLLWCLLHGL